MENELSRAYRLHIEELELLAELGSPSAARSLAAIELVMAGWRYGDPEPDDGGPDDDGGIPLPTNVIPFPTGTPLRGPVAAVA